MSTRYVIPRGFGETRLTPRQYSLGEWHGPKFVEGCVTDHGVAIVKQQQQPQAADQTRSHCELVDDAFQNGDFSNGLSGWTPHFADDDANGDLEMHATDNEV